MFLVSVLCASLFAACQPISSPAIATPPLDPDVEEYAVYAALLEGTFVFDNTKQLLIIDHTRTQEPGLMNDFLADFQVNPQLAPELVSSFKESNQQSYQIEPILDLNVEYQLISQEAVDELRLQDEASGWKLFHEKYPDTVGFVHLSRVAFNADLSQALVYIAQYHYQQPLMGGYFLMTREDGTWEIEIGYEWIT
jgi:hypothetical protein